VQSEKIAPTGDRTRDLSSTRPESSPLHSTRSWIARTSLFRQVGRDFFALHNFCVLPLVFSSLKPLQYEEACHFLSVWSGWVGRSVGGSWIRKISENSTKIYLLDTRFEGTILVTVNFKWESREHSLLDLYLWPRPGQRRLLVTPKSLCVQACLIFLICVIKYYRFLC
jgi:hypothetical protein